MINLPELSEQSVLNNLKVRYRKEIIYVRWGFLKGQGLQAGPSPY